MPSDRRNVKRAVAIALALIVVASALWVATPMVMMRPFGPQTHNGLALAYLTRSRGPALTIGLLGLGAALAAWLWRRLASGTGRGLTLASLALLGASAFVARANPFEWMFHPLPRPDIVSAAGVTAIADDDLVLGTSRGDEARAYPVRTLAYHHVLNDTIGGEPIVATY